MCTSLWRPVVSLGHQPPPLRQACHCPGTHQLDWLTSEPPDSFYICYPWDFYMGTGYLTQVSSLQGKHFTDRAIFPALGLLLTGCCNHLSGSVVNYWLRISSKQGAHDKYSGCLSGNEFNVFDSTKKARSPKIQVATTFVSLPCCPLPSLLASQVRPWENPKITYMQ